MRRKQLEKVRIMRGNILQRLGGVVMEIRGSVFDTPQYRYLERVQVGCGSWLVDPAGNQSPPGVGSRYDGLSAVRVAPYKLPYRISAFVEFGYVDALKTGARRDVSPRGRL